MASHDIYLTEVSIIIRNDLCDRFWTKSDARGIFYSNLFLESNINQNKRRIFFLVKIFFEINIFNIVKQQVWGRMTDIPTEFATDFPDFFYHLLQDFICIRCT